MKKNLIQCASLLGIAMCAANLTFILPRIEASAPSEGDAVRSLLNAFFPSPGLFRVCKDSEGNVTDLHLLPLMDAQIECVDFTLFPRLRTLSIIPAAMTNRSLLHLRTLPAKLQKLRIAEAPVDDMGLAPLLRQQGSLEDLILSGTKAGDGTLSELANVKGLRSLRLNKTKVTDAGLKHLKKLPLMSLDLSDTAVSDRGMREVKQIKWLIGVYLAGTKITDAGLAELADNEILSSVDLSRTKVTDVGILQLGRLQYLRKLNVSGTKVTDTGKKAMQALLPDLEFLK